MVSQSMTASSTQSALAAATTRTNVPRKRAGVQRLTHRSIDWDDMRWITTSSCSRRAYRVRCHHCGAEFYQAPYNALKDVVCRSCHSRQAGKAGWRASWADPAKREVIILELANHQRQNMTRPEQIVKSWLAGWGLSYETQVPLIVDAETFYILDFVVYLVNGQEHVIEVNGWHHQEYQADRDLRLETYLEGQNRTIIWLDHQAVISGLAMRELYQELST